MFTQQRMVLEESITRRFDTPLWFLTLGHSTEFQVTVNLSKPFPSVPHCFCVFYLHTWKTAFLAPVCVYVRGKRCNGMVKMVLETSPFFFLSNKFFSFFFPFKFRRHLEWSLCGCSLWNDGSLSHNFPFLSLCLRFVFWVSISAYNPLYANCCWICISSLLQAWTDSKQKRGQTESEANSTGESDVNPCTVCMFFPTLPVVIEQWLNFFMLFSRIQQTKQRFFLMSGGHHHVFYCSCPHMHTLCVHNLLSTSMPSSLQG